MIDFHSCLPNAGHKAELHVVRNYLILNGYNTPTPTRFGWE